MRWRIDYLRLILGVIFHKKWQEEIILRDFLVPKHHNKAFILDSLSFILVPNLS